MTIYNIDSNVKNENSENIGSNENDKSEQLLQQFQLAAENNVHDPEQFMEEIERLSCLVNHHYTLECKAKQTRGVITWLCGRIRDVQNYKYDQNGTMVKLQVKSVHFMRSVLLSALSIVIGATGRYNYEELIDASACVLSLFAVLQAGELSREEIFWTMLLCVYIMDAKNNSNRKEKDEEELESLLTSIFASLMSTLSANGLLSKKDILARKHTSNVVTVFVRYTCHENRTRKAWSMINSFEKSRVLQFFDEGLDKRDFRNDTIKVIRKMAKYNLPGFSLQASAIKRIAPHDKSEIHDAFIHMLRITCCEKCSVFYLFRRMERSRRSCTTRRMSSYIPF